MGEFRMKSVHKHPSCLEYMNEKVDFRPAYTSSSRFVGLFHPRLRTTSFIDNRHIDGRAEVPARRKRLPEASNKRLLALAVLFGVISLILLVSLIAREVTVHAKSTQSCLNRPQTDLLRENFPYFFRTDEEQEEFMEEVTVEHEFKKDNFIGQSCSFKCRAQRSRRQADDSRTNPNEQTDHFRTNPNNQTESSRIRPTFHIRPTNNYEVMKNFGDFVKVHQQSSNFHKPLGFTSPLILNNSTLRHGHLLAKLIENVTRWDRSRIDYLNIGGDLIEQTSTFNNVLQNSFARTRKRRTTGVKLDKIYHACCTSYTKRGTIPKFQEDTQGRKREIVQLDGFHQYFDDHVCLQTPGCTGCQCMQPTPNIQQAVVYKQARPPQGHTSVADLYEVAHLVFAGCCQCLNV